VPDLVGGDSLGCILPEDVLDRAGGDVMPHLPQEERSLDPVADEPGDLLERLVVNEDDPDLAPLPPDLDHLVLEVDILDIDPAELRDPDPGGVDRPDDQPVPVVLDGGDEAKHLAVLQVPELLVLDLRPLDRDHRICRDHPLRGEEPVERAQCRDDPMGRLRLVGLLGINERKIVSDQDRLHVDGRVQPGLGEVRPEELDPLGIVPPQPDIVGKMADHLLVALDGPGGIIAHPEVVTVTHQPFGKITPIHALFFITTDN